MPFKTSSRWLLLLIPLLFVELSIRNASAGGLKSECSAVDSLATIERPPSLIVGIAKDFAKKTCHFFVAAPPPNGAVSSSTAVDSWFTAKLPMSDIDPKIIAAIIKSIALSSSESRAKEIGEILDKNSEFLSACATKMQKNLPAQDKSLDGRILCVVPKEGGYLEFRISSSSGFELSAHLPKIT